jgi:hypothetical protein
VNALYRSQPVPLNGKKAIARINCQVRMTKLDYAGRSDGVAPGRRSRGGAQLNAITVNDATAIILNG